MPQQQILSNFVLFHSKAYNHTV